MRTIHIFLIGLILAIAGAVAFVVNDIQSYKCEHAAERAAATGDRPQFIHRIYGYSTSRYGVEGVSTSRYGIEGYSDGLDAPAVDR